MRLVRSVRTPCPPRNRHEKAGNMHRHGAQGPLHIAMIAPPWFTIPPQGYGGVESVCADLASGDLPSDRTLVTEPSRVGGGVRTFRPLRRRGAGIWLAVPSALL